MKTEEINSLFDSFEAIAIDYEDAECWSARKLAPVMGYVSGETSSQSLKKPKNQPKMPENP